ncbi:trypsin-like serine protease [Staphylococcus coagulans]|uniref:trypsin-like serine peptidase n=1 Tax=Staphylococcus coagulans TaxID=74706 RepID=UPI001BE9E5C0|nr:trypsin-like peptidase domain-containing protein [Staphylococcus coagulans]MBT2814460.1 trypsin-like serine protease [Staphylococcus coagulans]MBT2816623.1 trypsin-like serine protease [Staphylococcus coagulans]MBT2837261.1 trypsin-like serine protease [Staphylococcus coagulans]MBT2841946.1 trypsin-like serine protease [Staphylococcus coagulans]MBT2848529.1 trypsin-like serine protease [Staphylococcus coagulans]
MEKFKKVFMLVVLLLAMVPVIFSHGSFTAEANSEIYPIKDSQNAPHHIVGRIDFNNGRSGTGFVIGKNTVATNRHVAINFKGKDSGVFKLAFNQKNNGPKSLGDFSVVSVKFAPHKDDDVAILTVVPKNGAKNVGEVVQQAAIIDAGFIDKKWLETSENNLHIAGYPSLGDRNIMWGSDGKILDFAFGSNRIYKANILTSPGGSGSPLFNNHQQVIGINSSTYGDDPKISGGFLFKDDLLKFIIDNR